MAKKQQMRRKARARFTHVPAGYPNPNRHLATLTNEELIELRKLAIDQRERDLEFCCTVELSRRKPQTKQYPTRCSNDGPQSENPRPSLQLAKPV